MRVSSAMTSRVFVCHPHHSLAHAARVMWDHNAGCLPVVDDNHRPVAMITDRDICMAAYTQGRALADLYVANAMSQRLYTCAAHDLLADAERVLSQKEVRRMPVVNDMGTLVGLLSVNDATLGHKRAKSLLAAEESSFDDTSTRTALSDSRSRVLNPRRVMTRSV